MTDTYRTRVVHVNDNVPGAVYIGRAVGRKRLKKSKWANPYKIGDLFEPADGSGARKADRIDVLSLYRLHLCKNADLWLDLVELRGKPLACWCRHEHEPETRENRCHGDILAEIVNFVPDSLILMLASANLGQNEGNHYETGYLLASGS